VKMDGGSMERTREIMTDAFDHYRETHHQGTNLGY
jgi:predicted small metal-binding protein